QPSHHARIDHFLYSSSLYLEVKAPSHSHRDSSPTPPSPSLPAAPLNPRSYTLGTKQQLGPSLVLPRMICCFACPIGFVCLAIPQRIRLALSSDRPQRRGDVYPMRGRWT